MKYALLGFSLLAAGVVGALAAQLITPPEAPAAADDDREVMARLADMETEMARLREAIEVLRLAPAAAPAAPMEAVADSAPEPGPAAVAPQASLSESDLEEKIGRVIEERSQEQREAREKRFSEMAAEREQRMLDRLAEELGLTPYQSEELAKILADRRKRFMELRELREEGDRESMREQARAIRDATDDEVKKVLSADQFDTWKAQDSRRGGPGGGGRGRGGGGGR